MTSALYIHIPFCDKICNYCDFPKLLHGTFSEEQYLSCLINEYKSYKIPYDSLKTIYIGGGTPSCLSEKSLETLLSLLHHDFPSVQEFTIEANPESLSLDKIKIMSKYGINRVSLGVESSTDTILKRLNRQHKKDDVISIVNRLIDNGITNINLDFIYGLEDTDIHDLDKDLEFAVSLPIKHLSFYSLQIEEGTVFHNKNVKSIDDDALAKMYNHIITTLDNFGFHRYEVSNFAIPGFESKHNLTYWHDDEYFAIGLGASGYINKTRYKNTLSMNKYLNGATKATEEYVSPSNEEFEFLMLNLRLTDGFSISEFNKRFSSDFLVSYKENIDKVKAYIEIKNGRFFIKPQYIYTMDSILLDILKNPD